MKRLIATLLVNALALAPIEARADDSQKTANIIGATVGLGGGALAVLVGGLLMHHGIKNDRGHETGGGLAVVVIGLGVAVMGGYFAARAADDSTVGSTSKPLGTAPHTTTLTLAFPL